jgi:hypothetical protein
MAKRKRKDQGLSDLEIVPLGPDGMMEMFTQFIIDSDALANEPEFIDFRFDPKKAYASAEQTHRKHARALRAAEKIGGEELEFLQDDMRVEAIDRLLTPPIRQDILKRLNSLIERLKSQKTDLDKVMMATAIQTLFAEQNFPWGMSNLIAELFQRSLEIPESAAEEIQLIEQVQAIIGEDFTLEDLLEKVDDPDFMKELEAKVDADSELYQKLANQADKISDEFFDAIWHGVVEIDIFSEDELLSYLQLVQQRLEAAGLELSDAGSPEVGEIVQSTIYESIENIVTPKRLKKMEKDFQVILKAWMRDGNMYTGPLSTEIRYLNEENPTENAFIKNLFLSQMRRAFGSSESEEMEEAKEEATHKPKPRRRRRGKRK